MKALYLLRHAEAETSLNDTERNLTERGRSQAEFIGRWMHAHGILPDHTVSSPAERTRLTAEICSEKTGFRGHIHTEDILYRGCQNTYIDVVSGLDDRHVSAMIVGHNPEISDAAAFLTGKRIGMPPGTLICIEFSSEKWISIKEGHGILKSVVKPP